MIQDFLEMFKNRTVRSRDHRAASSQKSFLKSQYRSDFGDHYVPCVRLLDTQPPRLAAEIEPVDVGGQGSMIAAPVPNLGKFVVLAVREPLHLCSLSTTELVDEGNAGYI